MITNILLIFGIILTSILLGFSIGLRRGIEISMQTAVEETIKRFAKAFDKLGMSDTFKTIVNDTFDSTKLNLWEDEK